MRSFNPFFLKQEHAKEKLAALSSEELGGQIDFLRDTVTQMRNREKELLTSAAEVNATRSHLEHVLELAREAAEKSLASK